MGNDTSGAQGAFQQGQGLIGGAGIGCQDGVRRTGLGRNGRQYSRKETAAVVGYDDGSDFYCFRN
jgi:hypothetical protein